MQHNRSIRILMRFSPAEKKEFTRYLDSSFFNRSTRLKKLLAAIFSHLRKKESAPPREWLFLQIYPEQKAALQALPAAKQNTFIGKKLDSLLYDLKQHIEHYLVWKTFHAPGKERDLALAQNMQTRGLYDLSEAYASKAERRLDQEDWHDPAYRLFKYALAAHRYVLAQQEPGIAADADLEGALQQLDLYYATQKLNHAYVLKVQEFLTNAPSEIDLLQATMEFAGKVPPSRELYLHIYHSLLENLTQGSFSLAEFRKFKALILSRIDDFPAAHHDKLFRILTNYLSHLLLSEKTPAAHQEFFEVMTLGLEKGYLMPEGTLSYTTAHKFVVIASKAGAFAAAEQTLRQLAPNLRQEGAFATCLALLYGLSGRYQDCLRELNTKAKAVDTLDKFTEKHLRLITYFEQAQWDLYEATLEAGKKQLLRAKGLGARYEERLTQYFDLFARLYKLKLQQRHSPELVADIEAHPNLTFQTWMLARANEFAADKA